ncbi:MAG: hypothetical protein ABL912_04235 [Novosphingobium sp.]
MMKVEEFLTQRRKSAKMFRLRRSRSVRLAIAYGASSDLKRNACGAPEHLRAFAPLRDLESFPFPNLRSAVA